MCTFQDLIDIEKVIEDASTILLGLTPRFDPFKMPLEHSTVQISSELVKTKLLNGFSRSNDNEAAGSGKLCAYSTNDKE